MIFGDGVKISGGFSFGHDFDPSRNLTPLKTFGNCLDDGKRDIFRARRGISRPVAPSTRPAARRVCQTHRSGQDWLKLAGPLANVGS